MNKSLMTELYEGAKVIERNLGIPALFQVAQCIQESGWDIKPLIINGVNSYNIYGIKFFGTGKADIDYVQTTGLDAARYKIYKSLEDCFTQHAKLLVQDISSERTKKENPAHPMTYLKALNLFKIDKNLYDYVTNVAKVYAEDLQYNIKVLDIIEILKMKLEVKEVVLNKYQEELKNSRITMQRLGIITDFSQKEVDVDRLAVILNRLITKIKTS